MLGSCPIESSEEWKAIIAETNGNRERALELWTERGYQDNGNLNEEVDEETVEEDEIIEELTPEEKLKQEDKFEKLSKDIIINLNKQLDVLQKKKLTKQSFKEAELARLIANISALEGVDSIYEFIKDAYSKSKMAKSKLYNILKNKDKYTRKEFLDKLSAINEFATTYSILDEISAKDISNYFSLPVDEKITDGELTPQQMLSKAIEIKNNISSKFLSEGIPLMADFLLDYKPENMALDVVVEIESLQNRIKIIQGTTSLKDDFKEKRIEELEERITKFQNFNLDKKSLVDQLEIATKDESLINFLFDPLISSQDSALGLFAGAIKAEIEKARLDDINIRRELAVVFNEFASSESSSKDTTAKFNEGLYEFIDVPVFDKDGKPTGENTKAAAFIQKYNIDEYNKSRNEMYKSIGDEPILSETPTIEEKKKLAEWKKSIKNWYKANTQPKSKKERDQILADKEQDRVNGVLTEDEYQDWLSRNRYEYLGETVYMKDLSEPSNDYLNPKWTALYDTNDNPINEKGKYHKYLWNLYLSAQDKLPLRKKNNIYLIPSIEKTNLERLQDNGIKNAATNAVTDTFKVKNYDTQYGGSNLSKHDIKILPVYYTQPMDAEDVSLDLARSVLMFSSMANRYEALNNVNGEISLFKKIIESREVVKTDSKGRAKIDKFAEKFGFKDYIKANGEGYSKMHLDAFIDMVVYGEMQAKEEILGFSADKITNTLLGYSSITTIAADLLKGIANNLQGNIQLVIEAASSEFFSLKHLRKGKAYYAKSVTSFLSDFGKNTPESLAGRLVERYDPLQGNFKDTYGNSISSSVARKLFRTDTLFFNQHFGEHEIQVSTMFALMESVMVKDNKTGEDITLLQAHILYGDQGVEANTDFTEKQRQSFQNRLHALSKRLNGVYNDFDKATAQRYSLGRLGMMYRKHLVPGYKRRFKSLSMDYELGSPTEGFYRTFWNVFARDLVTFKWNNIQKWSTYSAFEKAQVKRTMMETSIILTLTGLIMILSSLGEDDEELKKTYVYNLMMYEMIRMQSETSSYISPTDAYRVVKSPSAMVSTVERMIKFTDQFLLTWDSEKLSYQRKQGVWEKGDNKSWAYFLKLMGYSGYNISPETAIESFKSSFVK